MGNHRRAIKEVVKGNRKVIRELSSDGVHLLKGNHVWRKLLHSCEIVINRIDISEPVMCWCGIDGNVERWIITEL